MRDDNCNIHVMEANRAGMQLVERRAGRGLHHLPEEVAFRLIPQKEKEPAQ